MQCNDDYGRRREPLCPHQLNKQLWKTFAVYVVTCNTSISGSWNFCSVVIHHFLRRPIGIQFVFKIIDRGSMHLKYLKLPTLRFRRCRGDMIETYKLLTHRCDNRNGLPLLQLDLNDRTRGNDMKLVKNHVRYDMRKYFFTCRIINL